MLSEKPKTHTCFICHSKGTAYFKTNKVCSDCCELLKRGEHSVKQIREISKQNKLLCVPYVN